MLIGCASVGGIFLVGAIGLNVTGKWTSSSVWLLTGWLAVCIWIAGTLVYVNGQEKDDDKIRATVVMDASIALIVGLVGITFWQHETAGSWAAALLWSAACLSLGGLVGMLFGVPRSATGESPIGQISDSLTKIIVGLGLTNLTKIPDQLYRWANYVSVGIGKEHASNQAALGMILYFVVLGFVGGYLLTNLFLQNLITTFNAVRGEVR